MTCDKHEFSPVYKWCDGEGGSCCAREASGTCLSCGTVLCQYHANIHCCCEEEKVGGTD